MTMWVELWGTIQIHRWLKGLRRLVLMDTLGSAKFKSEADARFYKGNLENSQKELERYKADSTTRDPGSTTRRHAVVL